MDPGIENYTITSMGFFFNTLNYFLCVTLRKFQSPIFPATPEGIKMQMNMALGLNKNH